jgi:hypothetical protein
MPCTHPAAQQHLLLWVHFNTCSSQAAQTNPMCLVSLQRAYQVHLGAGRLSSSCRKGQSLCFKKRQQLSGGVGAKTCSSTQAWDTLEVRYRAQQQICLFVQHVNDLTASLCHA